MSTSRLIILGDKDWTDWNTVETAIDAWWEGTGHDTKAVIALCEEPTGASKMGELCWLRRGAEQLGVFTTAPYFNANHRSQAEQIQAMVSGGADLALVFASEDSGHADEARRIAVEAGIPEILHVAPAREGVYPMAIRAECCPGRGCTTDLFLTKATDDSGSPAYVYRRQSNGDEYGPAAEVAPS